MIGAGGGADESVRTRARCAWGKFNELMPILISRGASEKLKGKIKNYKNLSKFYKTCV
jgi:hypothetical protein